MPRLRSALRQFFPAALQAFDDLAAGEALELLARAPDPDRAAQLPRLTVVATLRRAGRRDLEGRATPAETVSINLRGPHPAVAAILAATAGILYGSALSPLSRRSPEGQPGYRFCSHQVSSETKPPPRAVATPRRK